MAPPLFPCCCLRQQAYSHLAEYILLVTKRKATGRSLGVCRSTKKGSRTITNIHIRDDQQQQGRRLEQDVVRRGDCALACHFRCVQGDKRIVGNYIRQQQQHAVADEPAYRHKSKKLCIPKSREHELDLLVVQDDDDASDGRRKMTRTTADDAMNDRGTKHTLPQRSCLTAKL